jgi:hypothetical protein
MVVIVLFSSCATFRKAHRVPEPTNPDGELAHSICFLGNMDAGDILSPGKRTEALHLLTKGSANNTLLLLGNNAGRIPISDSSSVYKVSEDLQTLRERYAIAGRHKGQVYAIPGASEWDNGGRYGWQMVRAVEYYLERVLGYGDIVQPDHGCPGPQEIHLDDATVLLLIDTQWWLHNWPKPGGEDGCDVSNSAEFVAAVEDAIQRNYNKKIIVAGHHAMYSSGRRGGYFPLKTHLFPFTEIDNKIFLPLPGIGTLYVLYRKVLGDDQDQASPRYKQLVKSLMEVFKRHKNLMYLSGSEHSLEYQRTEDVHLINSGSIALAKELHSSKSISACSEKGFGMLRLYTSGAVWLEFYAEAGTHYALVFQKKILDSTPAAVPQPARDTTRDYTDSIKTAAANSSLLNKRERPGMMGNNYRAAWGVPIRGVPYFDIGHEHGGLSIVKRGGGMQTKSLRLEDSLGREYVLRSVEKFPLKALPDDLRGTIAENVIEEQISASHPYAALAIPRLAAAAGIYHTNPRLVWLPDDPALGVYREIFGNSLYLFEERPDEAHQGVKSFGYSDKIISTPSVLEDLIEHPSRYVDKNHVVRSRLFDILIGDWDRHDDQWRWARFEDSDDRKYYRPIPRDRDQAFFWSDGWLLKVATRRWGMPKFQGFHHEIRDVAGMNFNARYFDRTFTTEATLEDWLNEARILQKRITDTDIEQAVRDLPPEAFALHGQEIINKLKQRKQDLPSYARQMYMFLANEVDVLGSEEPDLFVVHHEPSGLTHVSVYRIKGDDQEIQYKRYERAFKSTETKEIRLYGFGGDDVFEVTGTAPRAVRVRIIGGAGDDAVHDEADVGGWRKPTLVYDRRSGIEISGSGDTADKTSDHKRGINAYNRKAFQYDVAMPLVTARYNPDDRVFIGAGVMYTTHGFRKDPYKSRHLMKADIAPWSQSYSFSYVGQYTDVAGQWDFILNASISAPSFTDYFYGYGNATSFDEESFERDEGYYRVRYKHYILHPEFEWSSGNQHHKLLLGGGYQSINIGSALNESGIEQERFIVQYADTLPYPLLDRHRHYLGLYGRYVFDNTDNMLQPASGFRCTLGVLNLKDIDNVSMPVAFSRLTGSAAFYYSFGRALKSTLAVRVGGMANFGDYEFYHAARLGGNTTFRGVRRMRLAGEQAFYQNTELRVRLFEFSSPVIPGELGLTFFHDVGRVWHPASEQSTDAWHRGYGAGLWLAPLSKASLGMDYSLSTLGERAFYIRLGFFF